MVKGFYAVAWMTYVMNRYRAVLVEREIYECVSVTLHATLVLRLHLISMWPA
jgi:hypothetical protein